MNIQVSIVIAVHNAASVIAQCLSALVPQVEQTVAEIIIVDSSRDGTEKIIQEQFPNINLVHFEEPLTLPHLRGHGIKMSQGKIIAILDPYSIVASNWLQELLRVHQEQSYLVIGGLVELFDADNQNLWSWANYINEYGMFMQPMQPEEIEILPGSNISYKREILFDGNQPKHKSFWKTFVNKGEKLWLAPSVVVSLNKTISFRNFWQSRFDHGRCFAGMRNAHMSIYERYLRAITTPLLPSLLLWRWGKRYLWKRRYQNKFILTFPLQILLFTNWAVGECIGYIYGCGKSCNKLYY